jgi:hypothetical protein
LLPFSLKFVSRKSYEGETMRFESLILRVALAFSFAIISCLACGSLASSVLAQEGRQGQQNVSPEEQSLFKAITAAPDAAAKLKAAEALIKKYPKSATRPRAARDVADQIAGVKDAAQKISLAQEYQGAFKEPSEQLLIVPILIEAYADAKRPDEAFKTGADFLTSNPDDVSVLVDLVAVGTEEAKHQNGKYLAQSLQYGAHAIEVMEADKKPADLDDASWKKYKTAVLPGLYQSMGILNLVKGDRAETKAKLAKAIELAPSDPFNYLLLAGVINDEYQDAAEHYKSMPAGPGKDAELPKILAILDQVIEAYAHTIALSEGNERLAAARQQYLHDLEAYYKYRHKNSTEGLQQLIDKYKVAAKP